MSRSEQRYEPLGHGRVRYVGLDHDFTAVLELDEAGFVTRYPGLPSAWRPPGSAPSTSAEVFRGIARAELRAGASQPRVPGRAILGRA